MLVAYGFLITSILATASSQSSSRHPICKQIEDVFHALCVHQDSPVVLRPLQTFQGKKGPQGLKGSKGEHGLRGEQGSPGLVNYSRVNSAVEGKISGVSAEYITRLEAAASRIDNLEATLRKAEARITTLEQREYFCPVKFDNKCFWIEIDGYYRYGTISFDKASALCQKHLGTPANVYSAKHYRDLRKLLVPYSRYVDDAQIRVWTGMLYNTQDRTATLRDGSGAPYVKWYHRNPTMGRTRTRIGIDAKQDETNASQHMYNFDPTAGRHGVICER